MCGPDPRVSFVHNLDRVVREHGASTAIETAEGRVWTYAELWRHAQSLRRDFQKQGVGKGDLVALAVPRSPEFVAGLVAAWLCEAVALPIDVNLPPGRIADMLDEAKPQHVMRQGITDLMENAPDDLPATDLGTPAYLIYTSGSSGRPKGVLVPHAGLTSVLAAQIEMFQITPQSRCWWMHGTGFDASLSDIGTALLGGATLCFAEREVMLEAELRRMAITHVDLPPAMLPYLKDKPSALRVIVIGGEVCAASVVREWASRVRLINVYGPTEATICSSMVLCGPDWQRAWIGEPVPGIEYRVDEDELCIRGPAVALGYPWQPEMWARRFVDGWYRTGDLVAPHEDGRIEFLGRSDRQIKLNGRMVCPEEIECALLEMPEVKRAVVTPWQRGHRRMLAACVEGSAGSHMMRQFLSSRLPDWMWPAVWCVTESLPVLANGKPDLEAIGGLLHTADAKRGDMPCEDLSYNERMIADLFEAVLHLSCIGPHEDFFSDLGGDSLAVVELVALASTRGLPLPADAVPRGRTVAGVAKLLHAHEWMTLEELRREASIPLPPEFSSAFQRPGCVLVTGAGGFLGRAVTAELKRRGLRVIEMNRSSGLRGDVRLPRFGWDPEKWDSLADEVDTVFHLAAEVKLFAPYAALRESQVEGTLNVLRFCAERRPKALHFASSLSVFVDADPLVPLCFEDDLRRDVERVHGGYAQSKWVAEQLVLRAREAGLACWIHRLGLLALDSMTGDAPANDWLTLALPGLAAAARSLEMDLTPVDHAARVMVHLACTAPLGIFHIANPQPVTLARLMELSLDAPRSAAASLASMRATHRGFHRSLDLFKATGVRFDMNHTDRALAGSGIEFPGITDDYLRACLDHARRPPHDIS
jgi:amino acid adenylation domain-containing protein/thioester reductase-like protein